MLFYLEYWTENMQGIPETMRFLGRGPYGSHSLSSSVQGSGFSSGCSEELVWELNGSQQVLISG